MQLLQLDFEPVGSRSDTGYSHVSIAYGRGQCQPSVLENDVERVNDTWQEAQKCQQYVDQYIFITVALFHKDP